MSFQILLNLLLAFTWMFLKNEYSGNTFTIGYILGLLILIVFRHFFNERFYLLRVYAVMKLVLLFFRELLLSNIAVLKVILKPRLTITPGIFALETKLTKDWEITTLANLITLTPGTLVVNVSADNKTLYIHAMDLADKQEAIDNIKNTFEKAIMEVSR
ncbi:Na+/H+ antiporter subunit E [Peribacillus psychrosaccharolyticus]|uniref:Na+/H+ antiporter subunit E n=1 Tax=Peribacillus psychrosaccharolyticus TaxID=1407 RepID=A0A974S0K3_PERPY|nr:Na+/H+ antiporter subunit E [Peribacillus psychrosaccharolyticus]MEC2055676.1 Na+/H+ antiporter subunit E [Peribacillus psychrosaccharolyticus]MED3743297.1 Na+/H+ antiporter subunit E [Peribacillus psychrosaccharolyticus]QQS99334.1 Na+/H+ antiporter subunit E [Peribacillus psychrosaccharolyticus]